MNPLQFNYNSLQAKTEFQSVIEQLPNDVSMYIVGGAVRNALFREFHGEVLIQRDYDQVITKGSKSYMDFLELLGYESNPYSGRDDQVVYRKSLKAGAVQENYDDWIVFDMHTVDGTTIEDNVVNNVGLTINGCAIKAQDTLTKPWHEAIIEAIPGSIEDIKTKQLRVNLYGYKKQPANFYAMLRFISAGFKPPSNEEVELLLHELGNIKPDRFERNVKKIWEYVGGEVNARSLVKELGITLDVFDESVIRQLQANN